MKTRIIFASLFVVILLMTFIPLGKAEVTQFNPTTAHYDFWTQLRMFFTNNLFTIEGMDRNCDDSPRPGNIFNATIPVNDYALINTNSGGTDCPSGYGLLDVFIINPVTKEWTFKSPEYRITTSYTKVWNYGVEPVWLGFQIYCCPEKPCSSSSDCDSGQTCQSKSCPECQGGSYTYCTSSSCTPGQPAGAYYCGGDLSVRLRNYYVQDCSTEVRSFNCASGTKCADGICEQTCTPSCSGKVCGSDGCNGTCGTCSSGKTCQAGQCVSGGCPSGQELCDGVCVASGTCGGGNEGCIDEEETFYSNGKISIIQKERPQIYPNKIGSFEDFPSEVKEVIPVIYSNYYPNKNIVCCTNLSASYVESNGPVTIDQPIAQRTITYSYNEYKCSKGSPGFCIEQAQTLLNGITHADNCQTNSFYLIGAAVVVLIIFMALLRGGK